MVESMGSIATILSSITSTPVEYPVFTVQIPKSITSSVTSLNQSRQTQKLPSQLLPNDPGSSVSRAGLLTHGWPLLFVLENFRLAVAAFSLWHLIQHCGNVIATTPPALFPFSTTSASSQEVVRVCHGTRTACRAA